MQVSFGQFIPVNILYSHISQVNKKGVTSSPYLTLGENDREKQEEITELVAKNLSARKRGINELTEQQRRVFRANVPDYELPRNPSDDVVSSEVLSLKIGSRQYLVTGTKDVGFVNANELNRRFLPEEFERELIRYIDRNNALSQKTINIYASDSENVDDKNSKYMINMIDFCSTINYKPISGDRERCR